MSLESMFPQALEATPLDSINKDKVKALVSVFFSVDLISAEDRAIFEVHSKIVNHRNSNTRAFNNIAMARHAQNGELTNEQQQILDETDNLYRKYSKILSIVFDCATPQNPNP